MRKILVLALATLAAAPAAFAKGPWLDGTYKADYPVHDNGEITAVFEGNQPKSLTLSGNVGTLEVTDLRLSVGDYHASDMSFTSKLSGKDASGSPYVVTLVAGAGTTDTAVLLLPNGVQVALKKTSGR